MATKRVTFDVLALAEAQGFDKAGRDIKGFTRDAERNVSALGLALATIGPSLVPIGAAAAGAAAGFGALGAVGVLAVLGINREMKAGTPLGKQYAASIKPLRDDLHTLEKTAAKGVLAGFPATLKKLQPLMPQVNAATKELAEKLGDIVSHIAPALVRLFLAFNPLIQDFADAVDSGAKKLEAWATNSGGAKAFVEYARQQLPKVGKFFQDAATAIGHIVQGLAPLGGLSLSSLGVFLRLVNAIPVRVLQDLAPIITGIYVATKLWTIAQIALNVALDANPIGVVVLAVAALAAGTVLLWQHWNTVWKAISHHKAFAVVVAAVTAVLAPVVLVGVASEALLKKWRTVWNAIQSVVGTVATALTHTWQHVAGFFKSFYLDVKIIALNIGIAFIKFVEIPVLDVFSAIVHGAAAAFGWVPGIGGKLKHARTAFDEFRKGVDKDLHGMQAQLSTAQAQRNADTLAAKLRGLRSVMNSLHSKSIDLNVHVTGAGQLAVAGGGRFASGGRVRGGVPIIVGEKRPELFVPDSNGTIVPRVPGSDANTGRAAGPLVAVYGAPGQSEQEIGQIAASRVAFALASR